MGMPPFLPDVHGVPWARKPRSEPVTTTVEDPESETLVIQIDGTDEPVEIQVGYD